MLKNKYFILIFLLLVIGLNVRAQQLVYDLRQDWVYYNPDQHGFLPVNEQAMEIKVISFKLAFPEFNQFYLNLSVSEKSYLFYRTKLIATIPKKGLNLKVDSLKNALHDEAPYLTVFGEHLLPGLSTEIRTQPVLIKQSNTYQPITYANALSNFFYIAITVVLVFFITLRTIFPDLSSQYLRYQRAIRPKTIDELIYKIQFLSYPNILFILFLSLTFGFEIFSFIYLYPGSVTFLDLNVGMLPFKKQIISWLGISGLVFIMLVLKYLLTIFIASIFSLKVSQIHFASSLRLLLIIAFTLLIMLVVQFLNLPMIPVSVDWTVLLVLVLIMEIILFLKLSLVTTHTLIYIIVYLCATELLPMALFIKIITG